MESRRPRDEFTLRKWQQESMSKVMSDYLTDVCNHDEAATVATHHARFLSETCVTKWTNEKCLPPRESFHNVAKLLE